MSNHILFGLLLSCLVANIYAQNALPGATGSTGPKGRTGASGSTGPAGRIGATGSQGPRGAVGPPGPSGDGEGQPGATGFTGPSGVPGNAGQTGATGAPGPRGLPGSDAFINSAEFERFIDEHDELSKEEKKDDTYETEIKPMLIGLYIWLAVLSAGFFAYGAYRCRRSQGH